MPGSNNIGVYIAGLLFVLLLIAGAWFMFTPQSMTSSESGVSNGERPVAAHLLESSYVGAENCQRLYTVPMTITPNKAKHPTEGGVTLILMTL